ncbi:MAG: hypothetical protein HDR12_15245 [Lachnospiraceae bacterium]|nr:hypothetical protein [Lachnospiraceae bacterium]
MKTKKLLACLMAGAMVLSLTACGNDADQSSNDQNDAETTVETPVQENTEADAPSESTEPAPTVVEASIDFEDGSCSFAAPYMQPGNAAEIELSVADFNGSKALQVKNLDGNAPFVAIDVASLLGADVSKVANIEMDLGVSFDSGNFSAVSGAILTWSGDDAHETSNDWSVYMENANPKTAAAPVDGFVADAGNLLIVSLTDDVSANAGNGSATLYIDNIRFLDASGSLVGADTSVAFAAPDGFESNGPDRSNLAGLTKAVEFSGFATSAGAWGQAGFDMPQEIIDALVPGSVVEISYSSTTGNMWLVMPAAEAGWMRVGVGDADGSGQEYAYTNNSGSVAQVTYEQLAAVCGDDVSTWGATMQCESDGDWEVFSVKVGQAAPSYAGLKDAVELEGFAKSAGGWAQDGMDMTQEFIDALVPGSVIEVNYASSTGNMWLVIPGATAGWMRVGVGDADGSGQGYAVCDGSKCYITYETIAEYCGDDVSAWGTTLQCEADGDWEVYSVRVGTPIEFKPINHIVNLEGFAKSADGWAQDGVDMTQEFIDALVPGSVITISYASDTGNMWVVMNGAAAGWMRVGVGDADGSGQGYAACDGSTCQIPYEMIAEYCGDDVSTWGASIQCESDGAWEVYSMSVGQSPVE